jgi:hypothetical protein
MTIIAWLLAQSVVIAGKVSAEGIVWSFALGVIYGFWFILWVAIADKVSRSSARLHIAPLLYTLLAVAGLVVTWLFWAFKLHHSPTESPLTQFWFDGPHLGVGWPLVLVALLYLGRNIAKIVR